MRESRKLFDSTMDFTMWQVLQHPQNKILNSIYVVNWIISRIHPINNLYNDRNVTVRFPKKLSRSSLIEHEEISWNMYGF